MSINDAWLPALVLGAPENGDLPLLWLRHMIESCERAPADFIDQETDGDPNAWSFMLEEVRALEQRLRAATGGDEEAA
jgi:hypothetical protein